MKRQRGTQGRDCPAWIEGLSGKQLSALQVAALTHSYFSLDNIVSMSGMSPTATLEVLDHLGAKEIIAQVPGSKYVYKFCHLEDAQYLLGTIAPKNLEAHIYTIMSSLEGPDASKTRQVQGYLALLPAIRHLPNSVDLLEAIAPMLRAAGQQEIAFSLYLEIIKALHGMAPSDQTKRRLLDAVLSCVQLGTFMAPPDQLHLILDEGLSLASETGNSPALAVLHISAGRLFQKEGDLLKARLHYEEGHTAAKNTNDPRLLNKSAKSVALSLWWQGRLKEAIQAYEADLGSVDELSPGLGNQWAHLMLALSYGLTGQVSRGVGYAARVLELAQKAGRATTEAWAKAVLALIYMEVRQIGRAKPYVEAAIDLGSRLKDDLTLWMALPCRSYILCESGDVEKAKKTLQKAIQHASKVKMPHYPAAWLLDLLWRLERTEAGPTESFNFSSEVERILAWPDIYMKGVASRYLAVARRVRDGLPQQALSLLEESEKHLQNAGAAIELARTKVALAELFLEMNDNTQAETYARAAWRTYADLDMPDFPPVLLPLVSGSSPEERLLLSMKDLNNAASFLPDIERYLSTAVTCIMSMFAAERAVILRVNGPDQISVAASRNISATECQHLLDGPVGEVVQKALRSNAPLAGNTEGFWGDSSCSSGAAAPLDVAACVPMRASGQPIGAIYMDRRRLNGALSASSLVLLESVAAQIGLAMHACSVQEELDSFRRSLTGGAGEPDETGGTFPWIIGESTAIAKALQMVRTVAPTDATVLILGETGVGKELFAKAIHSASARSNSPFVAVNLAALPGNLVESELFGFEKGAFTGATRLKPGRFELADEGTIFLDEIGELPQETQVKLLRVLQERSFERVGGTTTVHTDFRLVAATNRDLLKDVQTGEFRADLYYRLRTVVIEIPPLRKRREDIPKLTVHFIRVFSGRHRKDVRYVSEEDMGRLVNYTWPGNVRELSGVIEAGVILSEGTQLVVPDLDVPLETVRQEPELGAHPELGGSTLREVERRHILAALESTRWRVRGERGAARKLGLKPSTLEYRMKKLGISR